MLDKVATVVDTELNDETALREQLLAAQMSVEIGEMSQEEFDAFESDMVARLREIRERQHGMDPSSGSPGDLRVTGVEVSIEGDEH